MDGMPRQETGSHWRLLPVDLFTQADKVLSKSTFSIASEYVYESNQNWMKQCAGNWRSLTNKSSSKHTLVKWTWPLLIWSSLVHYKNNLSLLGKFGLVSTNLHGRYRFRLYLVWQLHDSVYGLQMNIFPFKCACLPFVGMEFNPQLHFRT